MPIYRLAGQDFFFSCAVTELEPFERKNGVAERAAPSVLFQPFEEVSLALISNTRGWVAGTERIVQMYGMGSGFLMKVEGGGDYFIASHGEIISKLDSKDELTKTDREIIIGPGMVFALALRGVWSLHASAAMYKGNLMVTLGESGWGKSTLAGYLSQSIGWRLVADDILPVKIENGLQSLPHFPQLKLPLSSQPGVGLPENLPLKTICVLEKAEASARPELQKMSTAQTVQALLGHIAGTRMFTPSLLSQHLEFSTQAAMQVTAYRLIYPHRLDALPLIRGLLEKIC